MINYADNVEICGVCDINDLNPNRNPILSSGYNLSIFIYSVNFSNIVTQKYHVRIILKIHCRRIDHTHSFSGKSGDISSVTVDREPI